MRRRAAFAVLIAWTCAAVPEGARWNFIADWTFKGNDLTKDWTVVGQATWKAVNGELVGTPTAPEGGWLVLNKGLQDLQFGADLKCDAGCKAGVLVRGRKEADGSLSGLFIPYGEAETSLFMVTIDASGRETSRSPLAGGGIGNMVRFAPPPADPNAPARGAGPGSGAGGAPATAAPAAPPTGAPAGQPATGGGGAGGGAGRAGLPGGVGGRGRGRGPVFTVNEWNDIGVIADVNTVRKLMNGGVSASQAVDINAFGAIALYVGGTAEARYRDVSYQDVGLKRFAVEKTSPNFTARRINPYFYAFSVAAADMNRDGHMDFVSGPFIYYGPDFTTGREFYAAETLSPSTDFPSTIDANGPSQRGAGNWVAFAGDFTGDGWPDVLLANTSGSALYVNPKGEARRWNVYKGIIPPANTSQAEVNTLADVDKDGKLDLVYMTQQTGISWAKPDPANPTGTWIGVPVGGQGTYAAHGIGAGDVNGDGRIDLLNGTGWWEQPASGPTTPNWTFHPGPFGIGGAEMAVYDVNGDKLNDVVSARQAHGFGLNWYEQKRDAAGAISFVEHVIFKDHSTPDQNAGGVAFSELHGSTVGDINGDGIQDFIVGKRLWSHHESFLDPDPYGPPVLYAYLTVRDPKAPGGARFVPELINNASGAGSQVVAVDMNKDGVVDVLTTGANGSFIFFGKPRPGMRRTSAALDSRVPTDQR
jgi:3-keto-disaccharide hydrolase/FG-GAP-like repeat